MLGIDKEGHKVARERAHALAAHGVALVRHCRRADLVLLKGLLDFLEVGEQAQVGAKLGR